MPMIYVKVKKDRRAYIEGKVIPEDKFVPVTDTPYVRRLINHHEDLEVQGDLPGAPKSRGGGGRPTSPRPDTPG
jgi:hypothetical protein